MNAPSQSALHLDGTEALQALRLCGVTVAVIIGLAGLPGCVADGGAAVGVATDVDYYGPVGDPWFHDPWDHGYHHWYHDDVYVHPPVNHRRERHDHDDRRPEAPPHQPRPPEPRPADHDHHDHDHDHDRH